MSKPHSSYSPVPLFSYSPLSLFRFSAISLFSYSAIFLFSFLLLPLTTHADITSGLISRYTFDEGSGTTAGDSAGSNTGTLTNGPTWLAGKIGSGAYTNSQSGYVTIPDNQSLSPASITISAWLNPSSNGESSTVIANNDGTSFALPVIMRRMENNTIQLYSYSRTIYTTATVPANTWTHFGMTIGGGTVQFYINGSLDSAQTFAVTPVSDAYPWSIGAWSGNGGASYSQNWKGGLDDVRVYNRALSASDVAELYSYTGSGGTPPPPPASDTTAPTVPTGVTATAVSTTAINLSWTASTDAVGVTGYKIYRGGVQVGTSVTNSHSDTGLTASTPYSYTVSANDAVGNNSSQSSSASATTQTPTPDTTSPAISSINASSLTSSSATFLWSTNEASDTQVEYGLSTSYGNSTTLNTSLVTSHSQSITGLTASTLYHYRVKSKDVAGNLTTSSDQTFTTTAPPQAGSGEQIYIAQTAQTTDTGASCATAHSASWFNTAGNWGSGVNKISAGDTAHLCGTITSGLTAQGSGTSGSPITILFENGAKLSVQPWVVPIALTVSNRNYITIDGGTDGRIEAVDNGSSSADSGTGPSFGHKSPIDGIRGQSVTNLIIQNLTIDNLYQRKFNSTTDATRQGQGINVSGADITIRNNTLTDGDTMISVSWGPGAGKYHDLLIDNNTIGRANHGITIGSYQAGNSYFDRVTISNNRINDLDVWNGHANLHLDGIIIFDEAPDYSGGISNLKIFNNIIGPNIGTINTAAVFIIAYRDSEAPSPEIYNNVFLSGPGYQWTNGFIAAKGKIYNNTFIGRSTHISTGGGTTAGFTNVSNNLMVNDSQGGCTTLATHSLVGTMSDNNVYACAGVLSNATISPNGGAYNFYYGLPAWKAQTGLDANTIFVASAQYVNAGVGDYRYLANGVATNIGANLSTVMNSAPPTPVPTPTPSTYLLTTTKGGTGTGTVTSNTGGISCGAICTSSALSSGTSLTLTATPASGSTFSGWSGGGCSGTNSCTFTLSSNTTVTATFSLQGLTPSPVVPVPAPVTATPSSGGGGGGGGGTALPTTNYQLQTSFTLSLFKIGTGKGSVTGSVGSLSCSSTQMSGGTCISSPLPSGTLITLTATPSEGSTFSGWVSGGCAGTAPCTRALTANTSVNAIFMLLPSSATTRTSSGGASGNTGTPATTPVSRIPTTQATSSSVQALAKQQTSKTPFTKPLKLGSRGSDVKNLQIFLNANGFTVSPTGFGSKGNETTYYGPATARAVTKFQEAYRSEILTPNNLTRGTGYFGPSTLKKLNILLK